MKKIIFVLLSLLLVSCANTSNFERDPNFIYIDKPSHIYAHQNSTSSDKSLFRTYSNEEEKKLYSYIEQIPFYELGDDDVSYPSRFYDFYLYLEYSNSSNWIRIDFYESTDIQFFYWQEKNGTYSTLGNGYRAKDNSLFFDLFQYAIENGTGNISIYWL